MEYFTNCKNKKMQQAAKLVAEHGTAAETKDLISYLQGMLEAKEERERREAEAKAEYERVMRERFGTVEELQNEVIGIHTPYSSNVDPASPATYA